MTAHPVKFIITVVFLGVFLGLIGFAAFLDTHPDPFYHADCPLCTWQLGYAAMLFVAVTLILILPTISAHPYDELRLFGRFSFTCPRLRAPPAASSK